MLIGIVIWVVVLTTCALGWTLSARRRRRHPPERTAEEVWNDTDPKYRTWRLPWGAGNSGAP